MGFSLSEILMQFSQEMEYRKARQIYDNMREWDLKRFCKMDTRFMIQDPRCRILDT